MDRIKHSPLSLIVVTLVICNLLNFAQGSSAGQKDGQGGSQDILVDDSEDFEVYGLGKHPVLASHLDTNPNEDIDSIISKTKESFVEPLRKSSSDDIDKRMQLNVTDDQPGPRDSPKETASSETASSEGATARQSPPPSVIGQNLKIESIPGPEKGGIDHERSSHATAGASSEDTEVKTVEEKHDENNDQSNFDLSSDMKPDSRDTIAGEDNESTVVSDSPGEKSDSHPPKSQFVSIGTQTESQSNDLPDQGSISKRKETTSKSEGSTSKPEEPKQDPEASTPEPEEPRQEPKELTPEPKESTQEPEELTPEPEEPTQEPEELTQEPEETKQSSSEATSETPPTQETVSAEPSFEKLSPKDAVSTTSSMPAPVSARDSDNTPMPTTTTENLQLEREQRPTVKEDATTHGRATRDLLLEHATRDAREEEDTESTDYSGLQLAVLISTVAVVAIGIMFQMMTSNQNNPIRVELSEHKAPPSVPSEKSPAFKVKEMRLIELNRSLKKQLELAPLRLAVSNLEKENLEEMVKQKRNLLSQYKLYGALSSTNKSLVNRVDMDRYTRFKKLKNMIELKSIPDKLHDLEWSKIFTQAHERVFEMGAEIEFYKDQMELHCNLVALFEKTYKEYTCRIEQAKIKSRQIQEERARLKQSYGNTSEALLA